jgi:PI31 proteasome regulator N-terminal
MAGEYGLETLFQVERSRLKNVTDVLVLLTHWEITKALGFSCVGNGDSTTW